MRFGQVPVRRPSPARVRDFVFAVGGRAYVGSARDVAGAVELTDDSGKVPLTRIANGTEVEILAWRPRGSGGTRYHVRSACKGFEGWIAVGNLRSPAAVVAPAPVPAAPGAPATVAKAVPARASGDSRRRFGQRSG